MFTVILYFCNSYINHKGKNCLYSKPIILNHILTCEYGYLLCFDLVCRLYKRFYLGVMVTVTWVGGFGLLIPTWLGKWGQFGLDVAVGSCSILPDSVGRSPKEILFMGAFVVPCLSIVVCYARIFYIVRKTALKSRASVTANPRHTMHTMNTKQSDATPYYTLKTRFKVPEISTDSAIGSSTATGTCSTTDSKEQNFLSPHDIMADPSSSGLDDSYSPISFSDRRSSRRRDRSPSSALNATITQVVSAVSHYNMMQSHTFVNSHNI